MIYNEDGLIQNRVTQITKKQSYTFSELKSSISIRQSSKLLKLKAF